jgi:hypothetical protein
MGEAAVSSAGTDPEHPLPESGFRFSDVVLHDGASAGTRASDGREHSVFSVLGLVEASDWSTYVAAILIERGDDAAD